MIDLAAVTREAAARWRQDRALLLPIAGLLLFVPQWAVLLFVPDLPQGVANPADTVALTAWAEATRDWMVRYGPLHLGAALVTQWAQLGIVALYVGNEGRPTVGAALARAGRLLPRYLLAELMIGMPLVGVGLAGAAAPPFLLALLPAIFYVVGRMLLVGAAVLARRGTGAAAALSLAWRWSRGNGIALGLLAAALMVGVPILAALARQAAEALRTAHLSNPVVEAALQGLAAAVAAAAMLALSMCVAVLYRRLAR